VSEFFDIPLKLQDLSDKALGLCFDSFKMIEKNQFKGNTS
jgi:hypothetical protein